MFNRNRWFYAGIILTGLAVLIIPWPTLIPYIMYPTPEPVSLSGRVNTTVNADGTVNSQSVTCSIILTAEGPISALNPITAKTDVVTDATIPTLQSILNFSKIRVIFWNAFIFPYNSTEYPYSAAAIDLHPAISQNAWSESKQIIYPTSGQFDVTVMFENTTIVLRRVDFAKAITIESGEVTFSFVTSLVFVSLELVITGLTLLDFSTHARSYTEKHYSKTDP